MNNIKTYTYRVYTIDDQTGFSVWTQAVNEQEAEDKIRTEYSAVTGLDLLKITYSV